MTKPNKDILKAVAPKLMVRALRTFDKATMVVVLSCWAAAVTVMLFALYSLVLVGNIKKEVTAASAVEPILPKIKKSGLERKEVEVVIDRLQKRFPDLTFSIAPGQAVVISAVDGNKFRLWLTAISYADTIFPQYRWTVKDLCVGLKCSNSDTPMRAVLSIEKVSFSAKVE